MMHCARAQRLISLDIDQRLSARDVVRLQVHVGACPDCAALARQMRTTVAELRVLTGPVSDDRFIRGLNARLSDGNALGTTKMTRPQIGRGRWHIVGACTVCAAIALVLAAHLNLDMSARSRDAEVSRTLTAARAHALTYAATSPLEDVAAANLAAHYAADRSAEKPGYE